ncbi:MAG: hypothetical protein L0387_39205 [Acidobacteria bacterium]|nr:hypothetical protein [Acidobacteriota bacterium]
MPSRGGLAVGVRERLEDALILWERGRKHGAWIQVLIAAAATSRVRFPAMKDGDAFRAFIREVTPTIIHGTAPAISGGISVVFNADTPSPLPLDQVLYKHMRCNLVHEAEMPLEVCLSESRLVGEQMVADLKGGTPLTIPDYWVINLAKSVADAPENAAACAGAFQFVRIGSTY